MVTGITLGVAIVVGIDIANESASRSFDLSTQAVAGRATHYISAGSFGVDEDIYVELRRAGLDNSAAPVIADYVTSPQMDGITFQLLGVDPLAEAPFRDYLAVGDGLPVASLSTFLSRPGGLLISLSVAERYALQPGSEFEVEYAGRILPVSVVGTLNPPDSLSRRVLDGLLVRPNQVLRDDTLVVFDRTFAITGALQLMTTFVAFVGVLSAMMSLQLDKQRQLGILKAIGLTSGQLWRLIALETGLMGAVAGLLAMPTGYMLALILVYIINRRAFGWTLQLLVTAEPFFAGFCHRRVSRAAGRAVLGSADH